MDIGLVWRCHANEIRCKYFLEDLRGDDGEHHLPSKRMTSCWFKNKLRWPLTATVDTSNNNPKPKHEFIIFDILFVY